MTMFRLDGKVALVSGAGRGMGLGVARALAGQGAKVVVNDYFPERAQAAVQALRRCLMGLNLRLDNPTAEELLRRQEERMVD